MPDEEQTLAPVVASPSIEVKQEIPYFSGLRSGPGISGEDVMKGYVFGLLFMDRWEWYEKYHPAVVKLIETHGGRYLASGVKPQMKEGTEQPSAHVLLEFPDLETAENWYNDPAYQPLIELRNSGGRTELFIFQGNE